LHIEQETDKIEDAAVEETLDWVEEEERKEREAAEKLQKEKDDQWMVDQLKKEHGDDFGENVDLNFEE
jgi:prolyl oligopeptidase PreP (S9A serine peptidase family)